MKMNSIREAIDLLPETVTPILYCGAAEAMDPVWASIV